MDYLGFSIWELSNEWQKQLLKELSDLGITHVQFLILKSVYTLEVNHEEKTQIRVAKQAKTDVMMTSKVIRALITKGLLVREQHAIDKRAFRISLTKPGRKVLRKSINTVETFEKSFFKSIEKQNKLKKELNKLTKKAKKKG